MSRATSRASVRDPMLAGPAAKAITGQLILVDDGQTLPGGG